MENFTNNRSFANGIYMAVSFIASAFSTLAVGLFSDLVNMQTTFIISAFLMILGIPAIFWLPKTKK
jgi:MFS family permease